MEEGIKLIVIVLVLLFTALAIVTIFSDNFEKLKDNAKQTDEQSSNKLSTTWCKISHSGMYYLVDDSNMDSICQPEECSPGENAANADCNPPANPLVPFHTCCCRCG